jgi:hypothetical protein
MKSPVKLSAVFAGDVEQVELPDGRIVNVRPVDGIGFDLYSEMEADRSKGHLIWEIAARCLPSLSIAEVKSADAGGMRSGDRGRARQGPGGPALG